jgi:DNA-binding transcriptional regulator YdaS (Cro superfamily)
MADHLGLPPSTVQSWKTAGQVPAGHQPAVLERAKALAIDVEPEDVIFPLGRPVESQAVANG